MDRAAELREIYDALKDELAESDGSGAAAVARELRILSAELERIEKPREAALVDQLAERRAQSGDRRPPARRRKSG